MVGDFDYMVNRREVFILHRECGDGRVQFRRLKEFSFVTLDFSDGIPEGMEFVKKIEPKYDVKKDFEKLVDMIMNSGKQIYMKSSSSEGLSPISEVRISREKDNMQFRIDRSRENQVRSMFNSFYVERNLSDMKIEFYGNRVSVYFKNGYSQTIEFIDPTKVTIND